MIYEAIHALVQYGRTVGLIEKEDEIYARNRILRELRLSEYEEPTGELRELSLEEILKELLNPCEVVIGINPHAIASVKALEWPSRGSFDGKI